MPSPTTVLQLIVDGLRLTNAIGVDETLTADESATGLRVFNDTLENFSLQSLAVWGQANQTFNTVAGQASYTIGSGGNFNTVRPVNISDPAYSVIGGATFPCISIGQDFYNRITVKGQQQEYPDYYLYVNDFPLGIITFWPVPSAVTPVTFSIDRVLTAATAVGQTVSFPPGYAEAFTYALAVKLAPRFGKKVIPEEVSMRARTSLGDVKRMNKKKATMTFDPAYSDPGAWYGGNWRGW